MLKPIRPEDATLGMFVHAFAGAWLSHPFWRAKFLIASADDLSRIRASAVNIVIDTDKGCDAAPRPARTPPASIPARGTFGRADKARAAELAQRSTVVVKALFNDCRLGKAIDTTDILATVDDIADELAHNMSAFITVTRLRARDTYTYTHSVAVCALMINLARDMQEKPEAVRELGMAGLLHDIGKVIVPEDVLHKAGPLTPDEMEAVRHHPKHGHDILSQVSGVPSVLLDVCLHHHERPDGTGYPFGLTGPAISRATRMASVCDVYDALTSTRPYKANMSPLDAVTLMDASDGQFDRETLFRFMRGIGVYPAGRLFKLRNNRLAVTLPRCRDGLGSVFRVFYSTTDTRFIRYEDVVLSDPHTDNDAVSIEDPSAWFSDDWATMAARIMEGKAIGRPLAQTSVA